MQKRDERISYVMLFCALILVKNSKASLEKSMEVVPLEGSARSLAGELVSRSFEAA